MFKMFLFRSIIALAMLTCAFTIFAVGHSSAHAARLSTATKTTKTIVGRVSAQRCALLKKSDPVHAKDPRFCQFTLVITDITITNAAVSNARSVTSVASITSCVSKDVNHTISYTEIPQIWGYSQTTDFHWSGNCGAPSVVNHICNGLWAVVGWSISQGNCFSYPNGTGHTQAEDDVYYGSLAAGGTYPAHMYSDGRSDGTIYDWND